MRWLPSSTWHLTLLFLGVVHTRRVPELASLVDRTARLGASFEAAIEGGGGRTHRCDGVAWLSVQDGAARVIATAEALASACPPDITPAAAPRPTPGAHVTVARRADRSLVVALSRQAHGSLSVSWSVDRLVLMRSHLGPGGTRYETLHEATLYPPDM